jgi:serine/threonine protein kinase/Tol biopolymer transport system component
MSPQSSIAHYRITAKLGEGGMGEVWRATDTKLNREVAIKILPESFAQDPDRLARFTREAQVLAALNHPNIAGIYGVEERALVMELVPGPTLAERIAQGPIPLDEALPIAHQVAEALEYAHERSIIHRDLKPANIKITPEGRVKVLDFGLAKAVSSDAAAGNPESSPTLTMHATLTGVILGTAEYMSPEQARGVAADKRADIWSFGVVLYEMLTGRHLFRAETVSETLAEVLKTDPDWSGLPAETPRAISRLLRRCVERDRKRRLPEIGVALMEIDDAQVEHEAPAATPAPKPMSRLIPWIAAAVLLALLAIWLLRLQPEERMLQVEISAPPGYTFGTTKPGRFAISPDGNKLAFVATSADGKSSLWVRPLDASHAVRLPGTEDAFGPFWDPTCRWIAFNANGKVQKIEVRGGQPQVLCDASGAFFGGTWSRDGVILFSDASRTIHRVSAAGGAPSQVLRWDESRKENAQLAPQFLPDGQRFLYYSSVAPVVGQQNPAQRNGVALGSLDGKSRFLMPNSEPLGYYAPARDGKAYLLFLRREQLMAQRFDVGSAALKGEPVSIAEPLQSGGPFFSASENGVLILRRSRGGLQSQLTWFDREGKPLGTAGEAGMIFGPRISPGQKSVVFEQFTRMGLDIWLFDGERGNTTRFSFGDSGTAPVWSPDGSRIAYFAGRSGDVVLVERPASGIGKETVLHPSTGIDTSSAAGLYFFDQSWSRDERWLVLAGGSGSLYLLRVGQERSGGESKPVPFPEGPARGLHPSISPTGRWLLYSSPQTGSREVFLQSMPEQMGGPAAGARKQVSTAGGAQPVWRADGKEIFYVAADGKMMSVAVDSSAASLKLGVPKPLFQTRLEFDSTMRQYDASVDGKRFVLAEPLEESASVPITVIVNWPALLKKQAVAP